MCTVTYLPLGTDAFIITSNRDESRIRPTKAPAIYENSGLKLVYPKDSMAGGTWIGITNQNRVACLMNGAFEKHEWKPPYRVSRGIVLLDFLTSPQTNTFLSDYNCEGIEPFTIIACDNQRLFEFRWDGGKRHLKELDNTQPQIWSSAPLYPKPVREKREGWFREWLQKRNEFNREEIVDFHRFGGEGDPENDFVMNRYDIVQTVSITSIVKKQETASMFYLDIVENRDTEVKIDSNVAEKK